MILRSRLCSPAAPVLLHHHPAATHLPSLFHKLLLPPPPPRPAPRYRLTRSCFSYCAHSPRRTSGRRSFGTAAAAATGGKKEVTAEEDPNSSSDYFHAGEGVSWTSLGVSEKLSAALSNASLKRPSLVQAGCIPHILSGKDVVVAAETGSGKTHGYLVPLIESLCRVPQLVRDSGVDQVATEPHRISLILCPNVMLCEQVVKMAKSLCDDNGEPLIRVSALCGQHGWPVSLSDIIVSTPAALLNALFALGAGRHRRPEFVRHVKSVVFDEADMLLCGSFQNLIIRLINMFRFDEKQVSRARNFTSDNSPNLENDSTFPDELPDEQDEEISCNFEEDEADEILRDNQITENKVMDVKENDWRRVREVYMRSKQYIFVAATLPGSGKKTAGGMLKRMFPDAIWVSGDYLHRHIPRLEQRWIEVTVDTQVDTLIDAVKYKNKTAVSNSCVNRAMVFANTVNAAESVAKILRQVGIACLCYHSESSLDDRLKNLTDFKDKGGILVCTDAAARGLDIPNVSHVIQAEFAASAVDFLHRIGRTGRAGQYGTVTSLYTEANKDLVFAVRQAGKMGQPIEKAFSRKRSFRNKIKKRGLKILEDQPTAARA